MKTLLSYSTCCIFVLTLSLSGVLATAQTVDIDLNPDNYASWRDHILPAKDELAFFEIAWEMTFKDGILRGNESDKPILLWAMNGHPLGCT